MSLVSVLARENFITVVSDGLVVNLETGEEIHQSYKKFRKISEKQFVAFGGNQGLGERVVEVLGYQESERDLLECAKKIRGDLINEIPIEKASCQVVLGGVEKGSIVFYAFNNNHNQDLLIKRPTNHILEYTFLSSRNSSINLDEIIQRIGNRIGYNTPTKTIKIQKQLNDEVAKTDPSVNKITFNLTIRK
ncbi:hypothetical protein [Halalkalibacter flavus]|uniref:hypothetical protein n=1 Tax=Halalkalibacter flavus TaxID=3090668 RepID=UPI002FCA8FC3